MAGEEKLTIKSEAKGFDETAKQVDKVTDSQEKLKQAVGKTAKPSRDSADAQKQVNASTSDYIGILNQINPALGGYVDASLKAIKVAGGLADQQIPIIDLVKKATTAIKANVSILKLFGAGGALVGGVLA